jgi:hypothetical protein
MEVIMSSIITFLSSQPKTYIPILVIIIVELLTTAGFPITPEFKDSLQIICTAIAAFFIRRGMVKEPNLEAAVNKIIDSRPAPK